VCVTNDIFRAYVYDAKIFAKRVRARDCPWDS
jgi:hypothetical protein